MLCHFGCLHGCLITLRSQVWFQLLPVHFVRTKQKKKPWTPWVDNRLGRSGRGGGTFEAELFFMLLAQPVCFYLRTCSLPLTPTYGVARILSLTPCRNRELDSPWLRCTSLLRDLNWGHFTNWATASEAEIFFMLLSQPVCFYLGTYGVPLSSYRGHG